MFTITDAAANKAKEMLKAEGKEAFGLRVYAVQGGG
jgi:Fe-S cluster assembly iron-binding protein IscA